MIIRRPTVDVTRNDIIHLVQCVPESVYRLYVIAIHLDRTLSRYQGHIFEQTIMGYSFAHVNDRDGLIAMCVIFSITSTAAVVLRFYARKFKGLHFQADDWLIAASLVSAHLTGYDLRRHLTDDTLPLGLCPWPKCHVSRWSVPQSSIYVPFPKLVALGCVQRVITGHSPVVNDWPISTETEHMAEKVRFPSQV